MGLEDFEKELAAQKGTSRDDKKSSSRKRSRSRSRDRHRHSHRSRVCKPVANPLSQVKGQLLTIDAKDDRHDPERKHSHRHHHRSSRHKDDDKHSHKRSRRSDDDDDDRRERRDRDKKRENASRQESRAAPQDDSSEDEWVEEGADSPPPDDETLDEMLEHVGDKTLRRDDWMQAPSGIDIDYVQRKKKEQEAPKVGSLGAELTLKMHRNEINHRLMQDLQDAGEAPNEELADQPAQHEVDYEFGDDGSAWRMTRLQGVYRKAKESGVPVEEVALERYADLREFDDAREEEIEMDHRKTYGRDYVGKIKPSGELYEERRLKQGIHRESVPRQTPHQQHTQGEIMPEKAAPLQTQALDQTALNRLKAKVMRAKLKGGPEAAALEAEYEAALAGATTTRQNDVVVLDATENRMLAGGRKGEVNEIENKRGRERGLVEENEDMTIEDMVRQERRTKGRNEGLTFAERIAKDARFTDDLEYMDENATKLSKHVQKSDINLRNMAIGDYQKMQKVLGSCQLCHHEDKDEPPIAPIISLATRVYLTLATEPEITTGGAVIVPIQHHNNLLECDDDEWEEIRNFMKCLTRIYHDQGRAVVFYENAAAPHRKMHAAMVAVPLPYSLGETAPAFFREAILSADEEWSQHKKIIDTLARSRDGGMGRSAFRKSLVKEMPYFHVWFELDGGLGHVVEDEGRWPRGDLFAREIIGGMVDVAPNVIKKQGRWMKNDPRVEGFRKKWRKFDWTRVLVDAQQ